MLITAVVVLAHVGVPLAFIIWLFVRPLPPSKLEWLLDVLLVASILAFLLTFGAAWHWVGMYIRHFLVIGLAVAAYRSYWRLGDRRWMPDPFRRPLRIWINAGVIVSLIAMLFEVPSARRYDGAALSLTFPLADGVFHIDNGGATKALNRHHSVPAQAYALDISRLTSYGFRAGGLKPTEPNEYAIFGTPVYAPCDGVVLATRSDLPDQSPPDRDRVNIAGNHVVLECDGSSVVLAHLRRGSVIVAPGDLVDVGHRLAEVGNSGSSSEPHLHLHAVRGATTSLDHLLFNGEPVALVFGDHFYVRNDVVNPRRSSPEIAR